jgi:mono/diheme cytochrome c family protein
MSSARIAKAVEPRQRARPRPSRFAVGAGVGAAATLAIAAAAVVVIAKTGAYDVSATSQHTAPVYQLLEMGMRNGVRVRAAGLAVPPLQDRTLIDRGFTCYIEHCEQCHGGPGVARAPFSRGLLPQPHDLSQTGREWAPAQLYWVTRHGLKMTGMPAWGYRLPDAELWGIVAFLRELHLQSPSSYAALRARLAAARCARR